jgi:hypothetical protein
MANIMFGGVDIHEDVAHHVGADEPVRTKLIFADLQTEIRLLTPSEQHQALANMFGKYCTIQASSKQQQQVNQQPIYNQKYIDCALQMMRHELQWMDESQKKALVEAQTRCVAREQEFGDAKLLAFLRYVDWHPKVSALHGSRQVGSERILYLTRI